MFLRHRQMRVYHSLPMMLMGPSHTGALFDDSEVAGVHPLHRDLAHATARASRSFVFWVLLPGLGLNVGCCAGDPESFLPRSIWI